MDVFQGALFGIVLAESNSARTSTCRVGLAGGYRRPALPPVGVARAVQTAREKAKRGRGADPNSAVMATRGRGFAEGWETPSQSLRCRGEFGESWECAPPTPFARAKG